MNSPQEKLEKSVDHACDLLKAMANRHRLLILNELSKEERSVGQLADFLGIRDSTVSQHLAVCVATGSLSAGATGRRSGTGWKAIWHARW